MSRHRHLPALLLTVALAAAGGGAAEAANYIVASEFAGSLQDAVDAAGEKGMVIVDQPYVLTAPLVLPRFFRLMGMGPQGQGVIAYDNDFGAAITFAGPGSTSSIVIENLELGGRYPAASPGTSVGMDLDGIHEVTLRNVTVRGFDVGVRGFWSFYVNVRDCNVSLNQRYNYHLVDNANSWRISGGLSSQSLRAAFFVQSSNNVVIDGVAMESNLFGVYTDTVSTHILNNRFECSPAVPQFCPPDATGVRLGPGAQDVSLIANLYSGLEPLVDESGGGLSYRFDPAAGAYARPETGAEGLRVELTTVGDTLLFDAHGRLRV
ncbi:MAG: hypothetical protein KDD47_18655, partial [Acidobacteria bacterium]|nr:hypothetical protein [Acidobacteriota bacterium]